LRVEVDVLIDCTRLGGPIEPVPGSHSISHFKSSAYGAHLAASAVTIRPIVTGSAVRDSGRSSLTAAEYMIT